MVLSDTFLNFLTPPLLSNPITLHYYFNSC
nr:MAG TPA: hypothetical protein [Caudoviricetes sp.]